MKQLFHSIFCLAVLAVFSFSNCNKHEDFGDGRAENLPDSVELGQSLVYVNGEDIVAKSNFKGSTSMDYMFCVFTHTDDGVEDELYFTIDTLTEGDQKARFDFGQFKLNETLIEDFDQIEIGSAFLKITSIDPLKKTVQGRFEAKFKKTFSKKVTNKKRYPDELLIQGVFHEPYLEY